MQIQQVVLHADGVEVSYLEDAVESQVAKVVTLWIPNQLVPEMRADLQDTLEQLVGEAEIVRRSPPDRFVGTR